MKPLRIFIVGAGRTGGALALTLSKAGHQLATTNRTRQGRTRAARLGIPGERFSIREADVVFLAVPDAAVAEAAKSVALLLRRGQLVAHCSGALAVSVLAPAAERGAHVGSLHPLCAIPSPTADLTGTYAAIDGDPKAARVLRQLATDAGLKPFRIRPGKRALYHAAAALASNGLVGLAAESARLLESCGLSRRDSAAALVPLMRSALRGIEENGLPGGLTGPIARGDAEIVAHHLSALSSAPESARLLYRALGLSLVDLSRQLGRAAPADLRRIVQNLGAKRSKRR